MGGIELARQMRVERPDIGVLLYSANLTHAAEFEFPFLAKPFLPKDLLSFVAECAGKPDGTDAVEPPVTEPLPVPGPVVVERVHLAGGGNPSLRTWWPQALFCALIPLGFAQDYAPGAGSADTVNLRTSRGLRWQRRSEGGEIADFESESHWAPPTRFLPDRAGRQGRADHLAAGHPGSPNAEVLQARSAALHPASTTCGRSRPRRGSYGSTSSVSGKTSRPSGAQEGCLAPLRGVRHLPGRTWG